jgi:hypothetical protein
MTLKVIIIGALVVIVSYLPFGYLPVYIVLLNINTYLGLLPIVGIVVGLGIIAGGYISS